MAEFSPQTLGLNEFVPLQPLMTPWLQTVLGTLHFGKPQPSTISFLTLADGDRLALATSQPLAWTSGDRIIVLVHGLTGSDHSSYMLRLTERFNTLGASTVRVNLRGCGPGHGMARFPYHSGRSDDLRQVLSHLAAEYPGSPVTLIGVSLGGNIVLKLAGEDGPNPTGGLDQVVAVSPPIDLGRCSLRLQGPGWFFDRYFVKTLTRSLAHYSEVTRLSVQRKLVRLWDIDEHLIAPSCGFTGAADYHTQASARPFLHQITVPTLVLNSWDDPVICPDSMREATWSRSADLVFTETGGHVGFLGFVKGTRQIRWMDELVVRWVSRAHEKVFGQK